MTSADCLAFYPQFQFFTPGVVLSEYLSQANARFSDFGADTDEARRLYVAQFSEVRFLYPSTVRYMDGI